METVDLSTLKSKSQDKQEIIEVEAAFMVILRGNGVVQASPDINAAIVPRREITVDEIQMAAHRVVDDIQASKTAQVVQMSMAQTASALQNRAESARLARELKL